MRETSRGSMYLYYYVTIEILDIVSLILMISVAKLVQKIMKYFQNVVNCKRFTFFSSFDIPT